MNIEENDIKEIINVSGGEKRNGATTLMCIRWVRGNAWSFQVSKDVTGEIGKTAALLCTFTHPHKIHDGVLTAIWRIGEAYNGTMVFKCVSHSSNDPCKTTISYMNKFKLLGNPRNNNISIGIDNLTWSDSNKYFCRVELSTDRHDKYEAKSGTRLHLTAPPRILNITVGLDRHRGFHAVCIAEGEPAPSLRWIDPMNNSHNTFLTKHILRHQMSTELHSLAQDGKYTCVAVNSHGRAEGSVYFFKFKSGSGNYLIIPILWAALGIKLLLVFVMLGVAAFYRKGEGILLHCVSVVAILEESRS
ncbi:sialic acid-binding Ig-like lectin 15 [Ascaphus truei]|uniref:sialic acid-binding Ig-like lectin 15 n=1 Tax=Ascaphus truei TaxID=8439 RepID=UPI003F598769